MVLKRRTHGARRPRPAKPSRVKPEVSKGSNCFRVWPAQRVYAVGWQAGGGRPQYALGARTAGSPPAGRANQSLTGALGWTQLAWPTRKAYFRLPDSSPQGDGMPASISKSAQGADAVQGCARRPALR